MRRVWLCIAVYGCFNIGLLRYRDAHERAVQCSCNGCTGYCAYTSSIGWAVSRKAGGRLKQLKKQTRSQKQLLQKWKLNPADWMIERDTTEELVIVHRHFDRVKKIIPKGGDRE